MSLQTVLSVIENLLALPKKYFGEELLILWHSGEPLLRGVDFYRQAFGLFENVTSRKNVKVVHSIQTNCVLIDSQWCCLFREYNVSIGASIDGSEDQNKNRVDFSGKPTWQKTMRGIGTLRGEGIPFGIISVVDEVSARDPISLIEFLSGLNPESIGLTFQEKLDKSSSSTGVDTKHFWQTVMAYWKQNPHIPIREIMNIYNIISEELFCSQDGINTEDIMFGVGYDGSISVLSPEFIDSSKNRHNTIVGNLVNITFEHIAEMMESSQTWYVNDFLRGKELCASTCEYFPVCGGGYAANKFFELGTCNGTRTTHCMSTVIHVVDEILANFT